jgi:VanZ family protein
MKSKFMPKNNRSLILAWTIILLWLILIFLFSAQPSKETNSLSMGVARLVVEATASLGIGTGGAAGSVARVNAVARKFAHFFLYFVLGLLVSHGMRRSGVRGWRAALLSVLFCAVYATSDELHQWFVPGRQASAMDVFVDTTGAAVGIVFGVVVMRVAGLRVKLFKK